jgi:hypothetical protein
MGEKKARHVVVEEEKKATLYEISLSFILESL